MFCEDGLGADDPFMRSVVDLLVAETPDKGGADFAVILCGYVSDRLVGSFVFDFYIGCAAT